MTNKYICIHGHFYQPPRENPWLEEVEIQYSAFPFHDWNDRITTECYAPNTAARLLNDEGRIIDIVSNYKSMSFNFGPTLMTWLYGHHRDIHDAIVEADRQSMEQFFGHGSALAQCYNHLIMPLANRRDKITQIKWGIRDFVYRFGRQPEGMWLPETAVDLETLELLVEHGIAFTILAPRQASRIRKIDNDDEWHDVSNERIDPRRAYRCALPSGNTISLFFYDGKVAQDVAFKGLLHSGHDLANRMLGVFSEEDETQLAHIATDGETFGHHHCYGEMALAYCLDEIKTRPEVKITIYGEFLEKHPPEYDVEIFENSSWSCVHGVERWRSDCGCNSGIHQGWTQTWRAPLRGALDWLRDNMANIYEEQTQELLHDPWQARDNFIEVILDRSNESVDRFLADHAVRDLTAVEKIVILKMLEMQRHALLMYTSCGWFFDDISGIETIQVIAYAIRALQLPREVSGISLEQPFIKLLERAPSNAHVFANGAVVYQKEIQPSILDLYRVGVHFAIASLFEEKPEDVRLYTYEAENLEYDRISMGMHKCAQGRVRIRSRITRQEAELYFSVLHFGDQNLIAGIGDYDPQEAKLKELTAFHKDIKEAFLNNYIPDVINLIENHYPEHLYSLRHLFRDEQHKILNLAMQSRLDEIRISFRQLFDYHYPQLQMIRQLRTPQPRVLDALLKVIFSDDLQQALEIPELDLGRIRSLVDQISEWDFELDKVSLGFTATCRIDQMMKKIRQKPDDLKLLERLVELMQILTPLELKLELWESQNAYFIVSREVYETYKERSDNDDENARRWLEQFVKLGDYLNVRVG